MYIRLQVKFLSYLGDFFVFSACFVRFFFLAGSRHLRKLVNKKNEKQYEQNKQKGT